MKMKVAPDRFRQDYLLIPDACSFGVIVYLGMLSPKAYANLVIILATCLKKSEAGGFWLTVIVEINCCN
jgi:hypothetical protein